MCKAYTSLTDEQEQALVEAAERLLELATSRHHHADETFTEGHAPDCAVPLLEKWMEG